MVMEARLGAVRKRQVTAPPEDFSDRGPSMASAARWAPWLPSAWRKVSAAGRCGICRAHLSAPFSQGSSPRVRGEPGRSRRPCGSSPIYAHSYPDWICVGASSRSEPRSAEPLVSRLSATGSLSFCVGGANHQRSLKSPGNGGGAAAEAEQVLLLRPVPSWLPPGSPPRPGGSAKGSTQ